MTQVKETQKFKERYNKVNIPFPDKLIHETLTQYDKRRKKNFLNKSGSYKY